MKERIKSALKWSEKYTKTDMTYLASGGFWLGIERSLSILLTLFLGIVFGNFVEPDQYGIYKYVISTAILINAFTLSGIGNIIEQSAARNFDNTFYTGVKRYLRFSFISTFIALCFTLYYAINGAWLLSISFAIAGITMPAIRAFGFYINFLQGKREFAERSKMVILRECIFVTCILALIVFSDEILLVIVTYFIVQLLSNFTGYRTVTQHFINNRRDSPDLLRFGNHMSAMQFLNTVSIHADKLLIFIFLGPAQLAIYAFASLPVEKLLQLNSMLSSLALPRFSQRGFLTITANLFAKIVLITLFVGIIALVYIISIPHVFNLLLPMYQESILYSQVLSLLLLSVPFILVTTMLQAHQKVRELYMLNLSESIFRIILMLALLPFYGIWGIVIALLTAKLLQSLLAIVLVIMNKNHIQKMSSGGR